MEKYIFMSLLLLGSFPAFPERSFGKYQQWINSDTSQYIIEEKIDLGRFAVINKSNKLYLEEYKPSEKVRNDEHVISNTMPKWYNLKDIAKESWTKERILELKEIKENIIVKIYMGDDGEFKEVVFFLQFNTRITPEEISFFEKKLKETKITLRTNDLQGSNYVILLYTISFINL